MSQTPPSCQYQFATDRSQRRGDHWNLIIIACLLVLTAGCGRSPNRPIKPDKSPASKISGESVDQQLKTARGELTAGNLDAAAAVATELLVQEPLNIDAKLLASEIEAARGNHEVAADLASSIDPRSRLGKRALEVNYRQLIALHRYSEAADAIIAALVIHPGQTHWRRHAWQVLNRVGRRQEASSQADLLCRSGMENEPERLSLLRRNESFPVFLGDEKKPQQYFSPGLGMARWHFTQLDHRQALVELRAAARERF